jgi:predicted molibdopterin-dependent oxidoreductase YjgC
VKGLYLVGENPVTTYPDRSQTLKALEGVDFLVVQDLFLSETAQRAHVVLPAVSFVEKEGTFTSIERRVQRLHKTIDPQGGAKSDFEIIQKLSHEMGYDMNHTSPAQVMEEINGLVPLYTDITYDRLNGKGLQWPCTSRQDSGSAFLYHDGFPLGKASLKPVESSLSEDKLTTEYPFLLVTVQSLCHSGSFSLWAHGLCELDGKGSAELNVKDAKQLAIVSGDMITITSYKGEITVPSKITARTPPGRVLVPYHYSELMVNVLTDRDNALTRVSIKKV